MYCLEVGGSQKYESVNSREKRRIRGTELIVDVSAPCAIRIPCGFQLVYWFS